MPVEAVLDFNAIKRDIRWQHIQRHEWDAIQRLIEDVANSKTPRMHPQCAEIRCTDGEWHRLKDTRTNTRTIVEFQGDTMIVRHVLRRCDNTYRWVEIFWKVQSERVKA